MTETRTTRLSDLGRRGCECMACGALFIGLAAFDLHRTGSHSLGRRCRTADEMKAFGLFLDDRGLWRFPTRANSGPRSPVDAVQQAPTA